MRLGLVLLAGWSAGCAATIPEAEHRSILSAQQTEYEHRLRRAEEARQRAEAQRSEAEQDAVRRRQALLERIYGLEEALAQKQRLWDESGRGSRESASFDGASLARTLGPLLGGDIECLREGEVLVCHVPLDLVFEPGTVGLKASLEGQLPALAKAVAGRGAHRVELRVGADDLRPMAEGPGPFELSAMQAAALAGALVRSGLDPSLVRATALGSSTPRADNETTEGRAANRRLELRFEPVGAHRSGRPPRGGGR